MSYREESGQVRWERKRPKEYHARSSRPQYVAEVFGSPRGFSWAWGVWHQRGADTGVELTFRMAKQRAEEAIEKLEIVNV